MEARMAGQPGLDFGMFVRRVVTQDEVQITIPRDPRIEQSREGQPLLMTVPWVTLADDFAVGDVEGRKQGRRPMAHIVMGHRLGASFLQGQARLGPIQCLDLTLLVTAQHQSVLWSVEIKADDIFELFGEFRIVRDLESPRQMRLKPVRLPNSPSSSQAGRIGVNPAQRLSIRSTPRLHREW